MIKGIFLFVRTTMEIIATTKINTAIEPNSGITDVPMISMVVPPAPYVTVRVLLPSTELSHLVIRFQPDYPQNRANGS